jgi:hypothetical protein
MKPTDSFDLLFILAFHKIKIGSVANIQSVRVVREAC